ncbi:MAG: hypothetical protein NT154_00525 [Verrucomicrobia bacterium]|nr:hypothetical protein [Verrucomicrobiota bacterium]
MEAYQQRVVDEKTELDTKLTKLTAFLKTTTFQALPDAEQGRMTSQMVAMRSYSDVLGERIAAF